MAERPFVISLVGGLEFLLGAIIFALFIMAGLAVLPGSENAGIGITVGLIGGIIAGGIPMVIGYGMLKGWRIMWWLGVIFNVISVLGGIATFPVGLVSLAVSVVIIYYLFRPNVKSFFNI